MSAPCRPYGEDLAYVHDVGFGGFARAVVDLGCGSGIWAEHLVGLGNEVLGIAISGAMIRRARRRVRGAEFRVGSLFRAKMARKPA